MQKYFLILLFCVVSPFLAYAQFSDEAGKSIIELIEEAPYGFEIYQLKEITRDDYEINYSSRIEIEGTKNNTIYVDAGFKAPLGQCTYKMSIIDDVSNKNSDLILGKYKQSIIDIGSNKYLVESYKNKETNQEGFSFFDEKTTVMLTLYKQKNKTDRYDLKMDIFYLK